MSVRLRLAFFVMLMLHISGAWGQVFENDAAKREKHFIYEVKQIDEFFERFNDDSTSFIRTIYKQKGVKYRVKRADLIRSLFNAESREWRVSQMDSFIRKALTARMPSPGQYYNDDWFAEASCMFDYNGKTMAIPVVLRKMTDVNKGSKWIIAGVRIDFIKSDAADITGGNSPGNNRFISPASHGNYFIDLENVFNDKEHLLSYFDSTIIKKKQSVTFCNAILKNQLKFLYVHEIKYHFLQVSNYIFSVENFQRESWNSGWLISRVLMVTPAEKENFKRNLLGK